MTFTSLLALGLLGGGCYIVMGPTMFEEPVLLGVLFFSWLAACSAFNSTYRG